MQLEKEIKEIKIDEILPNRFQPRLNFEEKGLQELSDSIKQYGIIQPLILRKLENKYEVIAGERRLKAASMAGLTTVPSIIMELDDKTSAELALIENLQRKDLTPIEEAQSYKNLTTNENSTQEEVAKKMAKSENIINNKIKLLNLSEKVRQSLQHNEISEGHARMLLQINDLNQQNEMLNRIKNERLTVKQVDDIIKQNNEELPIQKTPEVEEMDINPNMQKALTGIDIVNKPSNVFNDTEQEIVEGNNMDKTQMINVDEIKKAAQDIYQEEAKADLNSLLKTEKPVVEEKEEEKPKFSFAGKFFPSLEDETANMNTGDSFIEPAKNVEFDFPPLEQVQKVEPQEINITPIEQIKEETPQVDLMAPPSITVESINNEPVASTNNETENTLNINSIPELAPEVPKEETPQVDLMTPPSITVEPTNNETVASVNNETENTLNLNSIFEIAPEVPKEEKLQVDLMAPMSSSSSEIKEQINGWETPPIIPTDESTQNTETPNENILNAWNMGSLEESNNNIKDNTNVESTEQPILSATNEVTSNNNINSEEPFLPEFEEEKVIEPPTNAQPYKLKNAINMSRNFIEELKKSGYEIDTEELDLQGEYQFVIKIKKN